MTDEPDHTSITWNALTTAIEALDLVYEEQDEHTYLMVQDLLRDIAWYAGDESFDKVVVEETENLKHKIRTKKGERS